MRLMHNAGWLAVMSRDINNTGNTDITVADTYCWLWDRTWLNT